MIFRIYSWIVPFFRHKFQREKCYKIPTYFVWIYNVEDRKSEIQSRVIRGKEENERRERMCKEKDRNKRVEAFEVKIFLKKVDFS